MTALLKATELAAALRIDYSTVLRLAKAGRIPCVRLGGAVRFPPDSVERLVNQAYDAYDERVQESSEDQAPGERLDGRNVVGGVVRVGARARRRRTSRSSEPEPGSLLEAAAKIRAEITGRKNAVSSDPGGVDIPAIHGGSVVETAHRAVGSVECEQHRCDD